MTETALDLPGIIIKRNQLAPLKLFYRLEVRVSQDVGPSGNAAYQFRMNAPPRGGHCNVTPTQGKALKTEFVFICTDWEVRMINSSLVIGSPSPLIPSLTAVLRNLASHPRFFPGLGSVSYSKNPRARTFIFKV